MRGRPITCCFTGHRTTKLPWGDHEEDPRCLRLKAQLLDAVRSAYDDGFRHFICGMAQGCDFYFAEAVLALRAEYPEITLEAAVPCPTQAESWPAAEKARYRRLLSACDYETMVQDHYSPGCMQRRNRYMVDHSALVIAVFDGQGGGTRQTLAYALASGIPFIDISPEE